MSFRLYVDETGDPASCCEHEPGKRYLGLLGVAFHRPDGDEFEARLAALKDEHFGLTGGAGVVLHREEMLRCNGRFACLLNANRREAWDADLLQLISGTRFR